MQSCRIKYWHLPLCFSTILIYAFYHCYKRVNLIFQTSEQIFNLTHFNCKSQTLNSLNREQLYADNANFVIYPLECIQDIMDRFSPVFVKFGLALSLKKTEVVEISEMKLDDFYHEGFSDYCLHLYCYFHNVSDDISSNMKVPEFDKHLKKAGGHIGQNIVKITIKMKTVVWKLLMIKKTEVINTPAPCKIDICEWN